MCTPLPTSRSASPHNRFRPGNRALNTKHKREHYIITLVALIAFSTSHANGQSQAEMNRTAAKDFEKTDAELNRTYASLVAKVPDAQGKEKLKQSQRTWLAFRDAEAAFASDQARGGSLAPTIRYETMTELTHQRLQRLKVHLEE
jgi:uncharacterized protein YecT (DUF1311 family)